MLSLKHKPRCIVSATISATVTQFMISFATNNLIYTIIVLFVEMGVRYEM